MDRLKTIIKGKGLKLSWIACKLGITQQALSLKMNGKSCFTLPQVKVLKELLDLSPYQVIEIFLS